MILVDRLREQLQIINPTIPATAIEGAIQQIVNSNLTALIQANRQIHRWWRAAKRKWLGDEAAKKPGNKI